VTRAFFLLAVCCAAFLPSAAPAGSFAPHRAIYDMSLKSADRDSGIVAVSGEMAMDFAESCEGWTMEYRSAFEISVGGEDTIRVLTNLTSWESRDGLEYRFNVRNLTSGQDEARIEGTARIAGPGKAGVARYEKPASQTVELPAGTLFPTAHTEAVLQSAGRVPASLRRYVFDGYDGEGLYDVNAVVGMPIAAPPQRPVLAPLAGLRAWPAQIAFYRSGAAVAEPDHEVGLRMYENGVGDEMTIDFGRFKVLARLRALELGARPRCEAAPRG
jgi:hypothetical protein